MLNEKAIIIILLGDFSANNIKKKQDWMGVFRIFLLIMRLLILAPLSISISTSWKNIM